MPIPADRTDPRSPDPDSPPGAAMTLLTRPARIHAILSQSSEHDGGLLDAVGASTEDRVHSAMEAHLEALAAWLGSGETTGEVAPATAADSATDRDRRSPSARQA